MKHPWTCSKGVCGAKIKGATVWLYSCELAVTISSRLSNSICFVSSRFKISPIANSGIDPQNPPVAKFGLVFHARDILKKKRHVPSTTANSTWLEPLSSVIIWDCENFSASSNTLRSTVLGLITGKFGSMIDWASCTWSLRRKNKHVVPKKGNT